MFPIPLPVESPITHALLDPAVFVRKRNHLIHNNVDHMFSWRLSMINSPHGEYGVGLHATRRDGQDLQITTEYITFLGS
jgi:hypothetical protein